MIVVSNSSPIINLAHVGQLDLLREMYGRLVIPGAVFEIIVSGRGKTGVDEVLGAEWIKTLFLTDRTLYRTLMDQLDSGEAETIALGRELNADLLLLDERLARTEAAKLGLKFTGILGILVEAKSQHILDSVKPVVDDLIARAGFWLRDDLYRKVLESVGEFK
jgi:predicted nucleic acid-binding protein